MGKTQGILDEKFSDEMKDFQGEAEWAAKNSRNDHTCLFLFLQIIVGLTIITIFGNRLPV